MNTSNTPVPCDPIRSHVKFTGKELSEKITFLTFFMTCIVVIYHCPGFDDAYALNSWDHVLNEQIVHVIDQFSTMAMTYFFTITGYLLFKNFGFTNYFTKIRRRVFSLLVPYVIWQCIYFVTTIILQKNIPLSVFLHMTFGFERWPLNGPLWYVYAVFLLAITSPVLFLLFKTKRSGFPALILLILFTRYLLVTDNPYLEPIVDYGYVKNVLSYLPFYLIGCYVSRFSGESTKNDVFICLLAVIFISCLFDDVFPYFFSLTAIGLLPLIGLYTLPLPSVLQNKPIYKLSFLMYALHQPLIVNAEPFLRSCFILLPLPVFIRTLLIKAGILVVDILAAFVIYILLKRCCPKLLSAITGGRSA